MYVLDMTTLGVRCTANTVCQHMAGDLFYVLPAKTSDESGKRRSNTA